MKLLARQDKLFKVFTTAAREWINKFNLNDYYWEFRQAEMEDSWACYYLNENTKVILVELNDQIAKGPNPDKLVLECALHEVAEAGLLGMCKIMMGEGNWTEEQIESAIHSVVFRLQRVLIGE